MSEKSELVKWVFECNSIREEFLVEKFNDIINGVRNGTLDFTKVENYLNNVEKGC